VQLPFPGRLAIPPSIEKVRRPDERTPIGGGSGCRCFTRRGSRTSVGMTRAHLAEPHIVAKIQRGEEACIRPCVGA
jgi:hypothetical protein